MDNNIFTYTHTHTHNWNTDEHSGTWLLFQLYEEVGGLLDTWFYKIDILICLKTRFILINNPFDIVLYSLGCSEILYKRHQ